MEEMDIREDGNPFTKHIILIGNPGVGKSTILNGLVNQVKFKNGFSAGKGMTQCLQLYEHTDGITYGDTPGLSDVKMRKIAAEEITKALQKNGEYKIIFVVTVEAGRVRPDDVTTINLVLDSVKTKVQYAIIINKVSKRFIQDVKTKDDVYETFFSGFNSGNQKTNHLHYFERKEELDDLDDQIPQLPQEVIDFIYKEVPYTLILKQDVQKIQLDQFEKMKEVFETQIEEIKKDARKREEVFEKTIEGLENKRNEIQKQYQEQLEKFQIEQRQLYERMEEERKENRKELLEQQNRYNEEIQKANNENRKQIEEQNKRFQEEMEKKEKNRIEAEKKMKEEIEYLKNRPPPPPVSNGKRGFCCIF